MEKTRSEKAYELIMRYKIFIDRGRYWMNYFTFIMLIFITVTSMKQYAILSFLNSTYWLIIVGLASILGMLGLGYIEMHHTQSLQKEALIYARFNPVQQKVFENQDTIIKMLETLIEKQNQKK